MAFHISVELLEPLYQASGMDGERAEWPPHPARLFCALVAHADLEDAAHRMALGWLEAQEPPVVTVPARPLEAEPPRAAWVVTNVVDPKKVNHGLLPGRTAGGSPRRWAQKTLSGNRIVFTWAGQPGEEIARVLAEMAWRVPYLGRATGTGLLDSWCGPDHGAAGEEEGDRWSRRWVPAPLGEFPHGSVPVRVPVPGYLEWLDEAFEEGLPAWSRSHTHPYLDPDHIEPADEGPVAGPFGDMLAFTFAPQVALDPRRTLELTDRLRAAVMSILESMGHDVMAMPTIHGHRRTPDGPRPVAYLALPFTGRDHADGLLRGLAIALPVDMPKEERKALLAAALHHSGGLRELFLGKAGALALERVSPANRDQALHTVQPTTWSRPSRVWTTVTPMVLDRFPRKATEEHWHESIAASCRVAGLPEPERIEWDTRYGMLPGAPDVRGFPARRKDDEAPLPACHIRLTFPVPVTGPVVVGSKRNFGLGLCRPDNTYLENDQ